VVSGCGEDGEEDGAQPPPPVAEPADFPKPRGQTLAELRRGLGPGPVLSPSVSVLEPGRNRLGFGLFDRARAQIADAPVALYIAWVPGGQVRGPIPARYESLAVEPQFQSKSVASDPDAARSVYVAEVEFPRPGVYEVLGAVRLDERLVATDRVAVRVVRDSPVPEVGEKAPRTATPTRESVGGAIDKIETRVPPDTMHDVDFADMVGKKPAVLLFATPALCQSRVCGPVVDLAEQVKADHGDAAFIHMEIFRDNELEKGFRPQVREWRLPTEPWLFTVNRKGRIAARIEGAFSAGELERALDAATKK
jgi:hypothetical protein